MSQTNVETVGRLYDLLNEGDVEGVVQLCHDDFLMDMTERVFNPDTYEGLGHSAVLQRRHRRLGELPLGRRGSPNYGGYGGGDASLRGTEPRRRTKCRLARRLAVEAA